MVAHIIEQLVLIIFGFLLLVVVRNIEGWKCLSVWNVWLIRRLWEIPVLFSDFEFQWTVNVVAEKVVELAGWWNSWGEQENMFAAIGQIYILGVYLWAWLEVFSYRKETCCLYAWLELHWSFHCFMRKLYRRTWMKYSDESFVQFMSVCIVTWFVRC
jgi:hypothetical protein